jgi:hypothetical protein
MNWLWAVQNSGRRSFTLGTKVSAVSRTTSSSFGLVRYFLEIIHPGADSPQVRPLLNTTVSAAIGFRECKKTPAISVWSRLAG